MALLFMELEGLISVLLLVYAGVWTVRCLFGGGAACRWTGRWSGGRFVSLGGLFGGCGLIIGFIFGVLGFGSIVMISLTLLIASPLRFSIPSTH